MAIEYDEASIMIGIYLLAALFHVQFLSDLPVTSVSFNGDELKRSFNQSADRARMVVVFSPT